MKNFKLLLITLFFPMAAFANLELITWKGIYYPGVPLQQGVSKSYCKDRAIGTFIHQVKKPLTQPIYTDKGVKLDHSTFHIDKVDKVYLIHGDFIATGKNNQWQEHIHYFFYKTKEAGTTKGVWYSDKCKGFYKGLVLNDNNF